MQDGAIETRKDGEPIGIAVTNWLFLLILLSYLVGSLVISMTDEAAVQLVLVQCFILLPGIIFLFSRKAPNGRFRLFREQYRLNPVRISNLALTALLLICLMPLLAFVNLLSQLFTEYVASTNIMEKIESYPMALSLLCVGIIPAIGEEMTFRGLLYGEYRRRSAFIGALLTGVLFGLFHGNLNQMAYACVMGIAFAMVAEATGSTISTMLMHAMVNCSSVAVIYLVKWIKENPQLFSEKTYALFVESTSEKVTVTGRMWIGYGMAAAVGVYLARMVYNVIAIRCGTKARVETEFAIRDRMKALREIVTLPLAVAIAVLALLVAVAEIVPYL